MATLAHLISRPIYRLITAFRMRAIFRHELLLRKRLKSQHISNNGATERGQKFKGEDCQCQTDPRE